MTLAEPFLYLTSSIGIADIREPPDIAKVHSKAHHSKEELYFLVPCLPLPLPRHSRLP